MSQDLEKFGMPEEELFAPVDHSDLESEKITAPRFLTGILYSVYFLRKRLILLFWLFWVC